MTWRLSFWGNYFRPTPVSLWQSDLGSMGVSDHCYTRSKDLLAIRATGSMGTKALLLVSYRSHDQYVTPGIKVPCTLVHPFHNNSFHAFYQGSLVPCTFVPLSLVHSLHNTSFYILLIGWLVPSSLVHSYLILCMLVPSSFVHLSLVFRTFIIYNNSLLILGSSSLVHSYLQY